MKSIFHSFTLLLLAPLIQPHPPLQMEPSQHFLQSPPPPHENNPIHPLYQLNGTWAPSHYQVQLKIILDGAVGGEDNYTALGSVDITFRVTQPVNHITLHANLLSGLDFVLTTTNPPGQIPLTWTTPDLDSHFLHLNLTSSSLQPGIVYNLHATSIATIFRDRTNALYLSNYTDADLNLRLIAATQMESYHLRQLFPCFDEPELKATFGVELIHEEKYQAIANGGFGGRVPDSPNHVKSRFNDTVKMSTYLFAITIAEFDSVLADDALFPKPVRTWSTPDLIGKGGGDYTAGLTAKLLQFFDTFFGTEYPMEKMDSAAITHKGGAMENWGLILYRTDLLIYLPGETLETAKNSIVSVVSHEVAHQNFGNLVTCKWWSDIWLNEGFATYVSYIGVDHVAPEFRHGEWQINDALQPALAFDAGPTTHPLKNDAESPPQIDAYFGTITYDKGASINRMIEGFLTRETFQKGLVRYLEEWKYAGAEQDNLFASLQTAADEDGRILPSDITTILNTWTTQKSHPLIRVSVAGEESVFVSQERYADPGPTLLWYVPITVVTPRTPSTKQSLPNFWLSADETITTLSHNVSEWIMLNKDGVGFFRVLYDAPLTFLIRKQLMNKPSLISPLSRSQLLDDYFNLAFRGFVPIETALELTTYLENEDHFTVWEVVFNQFRNLHKFLEQPTPIYIFKKFLLPKIATQLNSIGLAQNDSIIGAQEIFRMKLMDWACSLGHTDCVIHAHELHATWESSNTNPIHVDIQAPIFCTIVSTGGTSGFDFIKAKYVETNIVTDSALKLRLLHGLACSPDAEILGGLLNLTLSPDGSGSGLAPAHRLPLLTRIAMNSHGRTLLTNFLASNLTDIIEVVGSGSVNVVLSILSSLSGQLSTQEELDGILKFIKDAAVELGELTPAEQTTMNGYVNTIRSNMNWMSQWGRGIISWMERNPHPERVVDSGVAVNYPSVLFMTVVLGGFLGGVW